MTEVPAFADADGLFNLLREEGVTVNAKPPTTAPSLIESLLSALLPTLLIVAMRVWLFRRASGGGGGPLGTFSRARVASSPRRSG